MTIPYVDCTWSPLVGCEAASPGCANCYAARLAATRLAHLPKYRGLASLGLYGPHWNVITRFCPNELEKPLHWRKPQRVFCVDMGDIALATRKQLAEILRIIRACQQHTFLLLTKRPVILLGKMGTIVAPSNVHLGVTAEDQTRFDERVPWLLKSQARARWVSLEPLIGPIDLTRVHSGWREPGFACEREVYPLAGMMAIPDHDGDVGKIGWCVVGCESGPRRRPCKLEWVESIVRQCDKASVPVFVKQLDLGGRVSREPLEWPAWARRRELPPARGNHV